MKFLSNAHKYNLACFLTAILVLSVIKNDFSTIIVMIAIAIILWCDGFWKLR